MSKQRYYNIQSALLQSEQDASKNTSDESNIEAEINQLQIESNRLDNESFYKTQAVTSKLKELSNIPIFDFNAGDTTIKPVFLKTNKFLKIATIVKWRKLNIGKIKVSRLIILELT